MSVDGKSSHKVVTKLVSKQSASLCAAMQQVIVLYRNHGHVVEEIRVDSENTFLAAEYFLQTLGVTLTKSPPGQHNRRAERAIRTLRTAARAVLANLPYKLPRMLYPALIAHLVSSSNMTPNVHTSPLPVSELFSGRKVDASTMLRAAFGDFIIAKIPNQSKLEDMAPRAELGIMVGRDATGKGTIRIFKPATGKIATRQNFKVIPHNQDIINMMNACANLDEPSSEDEDILQLGDELPAPPRTVRDVLEGNHPGADYDEAPELEESDVRPPSTAESNASHQSPPIYEPATVQRGDTPAIDTPAQEQTTRAEQSDTSSPSKATGQAPVVAESPRRNVVVAAPPKPVAEAQRQPSLPSEPPPRYPKRTNRTDWRQRKEEKESYGFIIRGFCPKLEYSLHISVSKALRMYHDAALTAIGNELQQMIDMNVWQPVNKKNLTPNKKRSYIPAIMFLKEKFKADGKFEKLKARLAGGGHMMQQGTYTKESVTSPTVDTTSVLTCAAIAAHEGLGVSTKDIKGAYLNAPLPDDVDVIMVLDPKCSEILLTIAPEYQPYLRPEGTIYLRIRKALYGLPQAALLWYQHLSQTLTSAGYTNLPSDQCVYVKRRGDKKSTICLHVDDLFHSFTHAELDEELDEVLTKAYGEVNSDRNDKLNFLGMVFNFNRKESAVTISQPGYVDDMLRLYNIQGTCVSAATQDLFAEDNTKKRVDQTTYASMVMKLMYLAKRTRPDILLPVTYLASRTVKCNEDDMRKLLRVFKFVNGTREDGLTLAPDCIEQHAYVDASYGVHPDARSHGGMILAIGKNRPAVVLAKSWKHKLVSRSSTEAELIALHDAVPEILWLRKLLHDLGYAALRSEGHTRSQGPTTVFQDNISTIFIGNKGMSNKGKTKHMDIRYFFIKEKIDSHELTLQHLPTDEMLADYLTKPLAGQAHTTLRRRILGLCEG